MTTDPDQVSPDDVLSVSELNTAIRSTLQGQFGRVWVSGEISDLSRPQSGHIYMSLKDGESQIRAVAWRSVASRLQFDLDDGLEVVCEGYVDVYPPRGSYQLTVRKIRPLGLGALQLALIQLRDKLTAEGLFDPARKKPLPGIPQRVAVVTSPTGAAIRDFLEVIRRRWPILDVTVVPTRVQGAEATAEIVAAIQTAKSLEPDVVVVTRGGGSLEDLWCFNDEPVIRAIDQCRVPVVSAIGHEIDVTLCDLVADVRALTPTEAAERIVPDRTEVLASLKSTQQRLRAITLNRLETYRSHVAGLAARPCLARPMDLVLDRNRMVDDAQQRLDRGIRSRLEGAQQSMTRSAGKLESLSPLAVLARGYSVTQRASDGTIIREASEISPGDQMVSRIQHAEIVSNVESVTNLATSSPQQESSDGESET